MTEAAVHSILLPYLIAGAVLLAFMLVAIFTLKQHGDRQKAVVKAAAARRERPVKG